jgi:hypothetical protein
MHKSIRPLPVHPLPLLNQDVASWMDLLAQANMITFAQLFLYVRKVSIEFGFGKAIIYLTTCPRDILKTVKNPFKKKFYFYPNECPIKRCDYTSPDEIRVLNYHLVFKHSLGGMNLLNPVKKSRKQPDRYQKTKSLLGLTTKL